MKWIQYDVYTKYSSMISEHMYMLFKVLYSIYNSYRFFIIVWVQISNKQIADWRSFCTHVGQMWPSNVLPNKHKDRTRASAILPLNQRYKRFIQRCLVSYTHRQQLWDTVSYTVICQCIYRSMVFQYQMMSISKTLILYDEAKAVYSEFYTEYVYLPHGFWGKENCPIK